MTRLFSAIALAILLALSLSFPSTAAPITRTPTVSANNTKAAQLSAEQRAVRKFYTSLKSVMEDGQKIGFEGRYKILDPVVRETFDMKNMTRYAAGFAWMKTPPSEQQELIEAFTRFSIATYASRFPKNDGELFEVLGEKSLKDGNKIVETTLTTKDGKVVQLNYLMTRDREKAHVMDVYLNGTISELATRRADFTAVIRSNGVKGLIKMLDDKVTNMKKKG
ncbi:MAG: ABC transporter substrate-binding protein [Alphaproteobacteria bacterium]|nr:ABC transporter substrate-binding protein [Alphaproteobacteria bacterium]